MKTMIDMTVSLMDETTVPAGMTPSEFRDVRNLLEDNNNKLVLEPIQEEAEV